VTVTVTVTVNVTVTVTVTATWTLVSARITHCHAVTVTVPRSLSLSVRTVQIASQCYATVQLEGRVTVAVSLGEARGEGHSATRTVTDGVTIGAM
jgi:hypothetical protein